MYKFLVSKGQTVALLVGLGVVAIFLISAFTGLSSEGYDTSTDLNKLPDEAKAEIFKIFNPAVYLTVAMIAIAFILAFVVFGVANIIKFPKSSMKALIGIGVLVVILVILYSMNAGEYADGTKMAELIDFYKLKPGLVKMIGGGITAAVILALGAVVIGALFEIKNAVT